MKKICTGLGLSFVLLIAIHQLKGNLQILDTEFFYLKSYVDVAFEALGAEGRSRYTFINYIDFAFITIFTYTIVQIYKALFEKDDVYKSLIWIPVSFFVADLTETGIIFYLNKVYPNTIESLKTILMIATPVKWFFVMSSLLIIVNGYLLQLYIKKTS